MKKALKKTAKFIVSFCLSFSLLLSASCENGPSLHKPEAVFSSGSLFEQLLYMTEGEEVEGVEGLLRENELTFSHTNEFSELYRLNESGQGSVGPKLDEVLTLALSITEKTKGSFDVTCGRLFDLWEQTETAPPDSEKIAEALEDSGADRLTKQDGTYSLNGVRLNLGGIAKGYTVGEILSLYLSDSRVSAGLISCTSSVGIMGCKPSGEPFKVGIRNPNGTADEHIVSLALADVLISTSGDYEKTYQSADGRKYHHILNPQTGFSAETELRSVTVVANFNTDDDLKKLGALTDALSTAVFVMGMNEESLSLLKELSLEAVFVTDGRVYITEGLKDKTQITDSSYSLEVIK